MSGSYWGPTSKGRNFLLVELTKTHAVGVSLDLSKGYGKSRVADYELPLAEFQRLYTQTTTPVVKLAELYREFMRRLPSSPRARELLGTIIKLKKEDIMTETPETQSAPKARSAASPKAAAAPKAQAAPKAATAPKEASAPKEAKPSAAQMFKDLIMEGKLTDDQIFTKVQQQFNLDDSKRGYVAWYRNHLKKAGAQVPEAKPDPTKLAAAKAKEAEAKAAEKAKAEAAKAKEAALKAKAKEAEAAAKEKAKLAAEKEKAKAAAEKEKAKLAAEKAKAKAAKDQAKAA